MAFRPMCNRSDDEIKVENRLHRYCMNYEAACRFDVCLFGLFGAGWRGHFPPNRVLVGLRLEVEKLRESTLTADGTRLDDRINRLRRNVRRYRNGQCQEFFPTHIS